MDNNQSFDKLKTRKGFTNLVLIGVVVIILATGGYLVWKNNQKAPVKFDMTSSWKTYTNTQYGFELKLPSDWNGSILYDQGTIFSVMFHSNKTVTPVEKNIVTLYYYDNIEQYPTKGDLDFKTKDLEEYLSKDKDIKDLTKITIDGQATFRGIEFTQISMNTFSNIDTVWVEKNKHLYVFNSLRGANITSDLFNQILSTLKFTK